MDAKNALPAFKQAVAWSAARLPEAMAQRITLGSEWYDRNGYFKFQIGTTIDCRGPEYFGYGLNPQGWTIKGHKKCETSGKDRYVIETEEGVVETHFKWNIENHFKMACPNAKPFDPDRFKL